MTEFCPYRSARTKDQNQGLYTLSIMSDEDAELFNIAQFQHVHDQGHRLKARTNHLTFYVTA